MLTKRILKNVSLYFSASIVRALISLAINPLIALNMTHYDYALTGFYTSFNSLLMPLFTLMFGQYYARNFFKKKTAFERDELGSKLISAQLVFGFFELLIVLLGFYFYTIIQDIKFPFLPYSVISFSSIIFNSIFTFYLLKLKLRKNAKEFFRVSLYRALILAAFSILLVVIFKLGALGKLSAIFLTSLLFGVYLFPKISRGFKFDIKVAKDALKFCWPLMLAASSGYFLSGFDRALLVNLNNNIELGLYNIALTISGILIIFQTSLQQTFQPDLFKAVAENNKKKLLTIVLGINALNILPIIIFFFFAPFIISVLTAGKFTEAYTYARILAFKNITMGLAYTVTGVLIAYGYNYVSMTSEIGGAIASIFLFKYLIKHYNFYGAAWGQVLTYIPLFLIGIFSVFIMKRKNIGKLIQLIKEKL